MLVALPPAFRPSRRRPGNAFPLKSNQMSIVSYLISALHCLTAVLLPCTQARARRQRAATTRSRLRAPSLSHLCLRSGTEGRDEKPQEG